MTGDADRDDAGELLLRRRLVHLAPGATPGPYAYHVSVDGVSACSGVVLDGPSYPLSALAVPDRCWRVKCRTVWQSEQAAPS